MEIHPLFEEITQDLPSIREGLVKSLALNEGDKSIAVRSIDDATLILSCMKEILEELDPFFHHFNFFLKPFETEFGHYQELLKREVLIEILFLDDFIFPESKMLPLQDEKGLLLTSLIESYPKTVKEWIAAKKELHDKAQSDVENISDVFFNHQNLSCLCLKCMGDFRSKVRYLVTEHNQDFIKKTHEALTLEMDQLSMVDASQQVYDMQRELEIYLKSVRFRLKRGDLNRVEQQTKRVVSELFAFPGDLAKSYTAKLKVTLEEYLTSEQLSTDLVSQSEYERFFQQLGMNLWRSDRYLVQEFGKVVHGLLRYKREDISSGILQEYLGQFWLHSEARRIKRRIIYHVGPTNSGKTYHAIEALSQAKTGTYLAPLRLLAGELYDTLISKGVKTTLLTGEEVIETPEDTHISSTIEMAKLKEEYECCVIDEIQMLTDPQRGWAWTRALVNIKAKEIHVCGDVSVQHLLERIVKLTGDDFELREYKRLTELSIMPHPVHLGDLEKHDALIVFSRRNALKYKRDLERLGLKVSIIYGRLGPEVRREQARKFDQEETDVIVSTDAIAMGMNLPIKRIIFTTLKKYIDNEEIAISPSEIKQIAGRAGRYKRFPQGSAGFLARVEDGYDLIEEALSMELPQSKFAMVGPDLEIFNQVNNVLEANSLPQMGLSEFLRLFNTMQFHPPFFCVDLKEMIELTDIVEDANKKYQTLQSNEIFGFACAPVNMGMTEHLQYYLFILNNYVRAADIFCEEINHQSDNIDYLETSIKCVELFQWLARHFSGQHFSYDEKALLENKSLAIEKLNNLLSDKIVPNCSSCGKKMLPESEYNICDDCFRERRQRYLHKRRVPASGGKEGEKNHHSGPPHRSSKANKGSKKKSSFRGTKKRR